MFEMLAQNRPVLASLGGEAAQILEENGSAQVVAPENKQALADAIKTTAENPENFKTLAKNGRNFVAEKFDRKKLAEKYLKIFKEIIK
jgi:glycosyltransferase involved in cell wall biosynthesis